MTNRLFVLLTVALFASAAGIARAEEPPRDATPRRPEVGEKGGVALVGEYVAIGVGDIAEVPQETGDLRPPLARDIVIAGKRFRRTSVDGGQRLPLAPSPHTDLLGKVEAVEGDVLTVRLAGRSEVVAVPWTAIDSIEVRHRQPQVRKGALIGAGVGLALGLGVAVYQEAAGYCGGDDRGLCTTVDVLFTGATTAVGAALGALSGAAHTRWEPIDTRRLTVAVMPDPRGGIRGRLAVRF